VDFISGFFFYTSIGFSLGFTILFFGKMGLSSIKLVNLDFNVKKKIRFVFVIFNNQKLSG
jgi:hypothetical protein